MCRLGISPCKVSGCQRSECRGIQPWPPGPPDKCKGAACYGCPVACPEKGLNIDNGKRDVSSTKATTLRECTCGVEFGNCACPR